MDGVSDDGSFASCNTETTSHDKDIGFLSEFGPVPSQNEYTIQLFDHLSMYTQNECDEGAGRFVCRSTSPRTDILDDKNKRINEVENTKTEVHLGLGFFCSDCRNEIDMPYFLQCLHPFCFTCLHRTCNFEGDDFTCPVCKDLEVVVADTGHQMKQYLKFIEGQFAKYKTLQIVGKLCMVCALKRIEKPADFLCFDCKESLCCYCAENHCNSKFTFNHRGSIKGVTENDVQKLKTLIMDMPVTIHCFRHPEQVLSYFCKDCSILVCLECIICGHSTHKYSPRDKSVKWYKNQLRKLQKNILKNVQLLKEEYASQRNDLNDRVEEKKSLLEKAKQKWIDAKQKLDYQYEQTVHVLTNEMQQMVHQENPIDAIEQKVQQNLNINRLFCSGQSDGLQLLTIGFFVKERLQCLGKECNQISGQLQNQRPEVSVVINPAFDVDATPLFLFTDAKNFSEVKTNLVSSAADVKQDLDQKLEATGRQKVKTLPGDGALHFKGKGNDFEESLSSSKSSLEGNRNHVDIAHMSADRETLESESTIASAFSSGNEEGVKGKISSNTAAMPQVIPKLEALFRMDMDLKSDTAVPFVAAMVTLGQKVIVADSANQKLKIFNMDGKCEADLPAQTPLALSHCGNRLFYCDDNNQVIMLHKESLETNLVESVATEHPHPLAGINVTRMFVANGKSIISMEWKKDLKGLKKEKVIRLHGKDKEAVQQILSLAVSTVNVMKNNQPSKAFQFAVSDWETKTVSVVNGIGLITATYTQKDSFSPTCVFFSKKENELFVVDNQGNRLLLLNLKGELLQQWSTFPAVLRPMCGCINRSGQLLLVGADQYLHVYTLSYNIK